jgi:hypothetical protein
MTDCVREFPVRDDVRESIELARAALGRAAPPRPRPSTCP